MIPLRLLVITAVIVLALAKEVKAPLRIVSITNFNIVMERNKKQMVLEEKQKIEQNIKSKIYKYIEANSKLYDSIVISRISNSIYYCSKFYNIPISLIMAIIERESSWIIEAISKYGARGLMQIVLRYPSGEMLWQRILINNNNILPPSEKNDICDINIMKPNINIEAGCYILRHYIDQVYYNCPDREILADEYFAEVLNRYSGGGGDRYINKIIATWWKIEKFMNEN